MGSKPHRPCRRRAQGVDLAELVAEDLEEIVALEVLDVVLKDGWVFVFAGAAYGGLVHAENRIRRRARQPRGQTAMPSSRIW